MTDYVPESLTEIIIAHGAETRSPDPELREIGRLIVMESSNLDTLADPEIREYMLQGARLVEEVLSKGA